MTTQFDASPTASALTGFAPFDALELAQEAMRFDGMDQAASSTSRKVSQLVDWNVFHPDGTDKIHHRSASRSRTTTQCEIPSRKSIYLAAEQSF